MDCVPLQIVQLNKLKFEKELTNSHQVSRCVQAAARTSKIEKRWPISPVLGIYLNWPVCWLATKLSSTDDCPGRQKPVFKLSIPVNENDQMDLQLDRDQKIVQGVKNLVQAVARSLKTGKMVANFSSLGMWLNWPVG